MLLHGVGLRAEAWEAQEALADACRVVAVDLPGHGGSDPLPDGARLPDYVAWGGRVLEAVGPASVAGHSMGARIAAGLAVERPDLVRRPAVVGAVFRRPPRARAAVLARAEEIAAGGADPLAPLGRWFAEGDHEARARVAGWLRRADPQGYATAYRAFAEGDATYADRWGSIACPVLVATGADDPNSTHAMARAMAAAAPDARLAILKGHRHMVGLTAPEAVTAALRDWLAVPARAEAPAA